MTMSNFELQANDIETALQVSADRIRDFGYGIETIGALSAIQAGFLIWCISQEERRLGGSFPKIVIDQLPDVDDPGWPLYIQPPPKSSLKRRMESYWGIRVAFTHTGSKVSSISNKQSKKFALGAPNHLKGCSIANDIFDIGNLDTHTLIRSFVQVRDLIYSPFQA